MVSMWPRSSLPGCVARSAVTGQRPLQSLRARQYIALADPGMSMERIVQAAILAGAHDFIVELPEGYDTVVGSMGVRSLVVSGSVWPSHGRW